MPSNILDERFSEWSKNILKILLTGPCAPIDLAHLFNIQDAKRANEAKGYRGLPVSMLGEALVKLGHEVFVLTLTDKIESDVEVYKGNNIELHVVKCRSRARDLALSFFKHERILLAREIHRIKPQIVHAHWTYEYALAAIESNIPVLVTVHDAPLKILRYFMDSYRFFRLLLAWNVRIRAKNLIFVSPYLLNQWKKEMFWKREGQVIPNIAPFFNLAEKEYDQIHFSVLTISESGKHKNVKNLLKAWPKILKDFPEYKLELAGSGLDTGSEMHLWAKKNNLDFGVKWHGYLERNSLKELLENTDVFVHPSLEESFGVSVLEAMAHGIPVIAGAKCGGVPYVLEGSGLLVNVKKPESIAVAISMLLNDRGLSEKMGRRGKQRADEVFLPSKVAGQYEEAYLKVLNNY
jgi:glycosyltransferase involved in cell wall biosynthesis